MDRSWWIFRIMMFGVLSLGAAYLGRRWTQGIRNPRARRLLWLTLLGIVLIEATVPWLFRSPNANADALPVRVAIGGSFVLLGFLGTVLFYFGAIDLSQLFWRAIHWLRKPDPAAPPSSSRRDFLLRAASPTGVTLAAAVSSGAGLVQARMSPRLERVRISVPNLHPDLEGFRIAQISDLHVGATIRREYVEEIVERLNHETPNLVALTGDFVDGFVPDLRPHCLPLAQLRSTHGSFYIPGNHEYYWGIDPWLAFFEKEIGARVLANAHATVQHRSARILLAGIEDHSVRRMGLERGPDIQRAIAGAPTLDQFDFRVLLSHQPKGVPQAVQMKAHLQLSGHTHAGQFFPISLLNRFFHPYWRGLNRHDDQLWVYVNSGTGYWGPPNRLAVPSELTLIELTRAPVS